MTVPPESIAAGCCYLHRIERGVRILRVIALLPGGRVQYESRNLYGSRHLRTWRAGLLDKAAFARLALRQVPCDWMPDAEGGEQ